MTTTQDRIRTLLSRNLFLKPQVKADLLAATEEKQAEILPMLEDMDHEQTKTFRKAVDREPKLFEKWGSSD